MISLPGNGCPCECGRYAQGHHAQRENIRPQRMKCAVRMAPGEGNRGKPAQTRIIKLATGLLAGRACTKVALFPYTGRRHQLRLHSGAAQVRACGAAFLCSEPRQMVIFRAIAAHVGHAIVGDWTYGDRDLAEALPRMYLHAWKLQMRLPDHRGRWSGSDEDSTWTAEDPFDKIENLEPILPKVAHFPPPLARCPTPDSNVASPAQHCVPFVNAVMAKTARRCEVAKTGGPRRSPSIPSIHT